ncbi:MAG: inositol monophosphatase family protein [Chloroflexota bacterium]
MIEIEQFAQELAVESGKLLKDKWENASFSSSSKGFRDVVTDADIASQNLITSMVLERYPTHGFLSEEDDGSLPTEGDVIWVIDPIDGTSNFSRQSPLFCISIAAAHPPTADGKLDFISGVVLDPIRDEMFTASKNGGAFRNGKPITPSNVDAVSDSIVALDWPRDPDERAQIMQLCSGIVHETKTTRSIGTAALALCYVACGRLDAYYHMNLQPWDIAAAALILQEAGGAFSTFSGNAWRLGEKSALGTNNKLHSEFINLIQGILLK